MWRKVIGFIMAVLVFVGVALLIGETLEIMGLSISANPILRLPMLIVSAGVAGFVYNLIKGEEPEFNKKQGISSKEISKRLAEMKK